MKSITKIIIIIFIIVLLYLVGIISNEKHNLHSEFVITRGKIVNKYIKNTIFTEKKINTNIYLTKIRYTIEITYEYYVNRKKYIGIFSNIDVGSNEKWISYESIKKIYNMFPMGKIIRIYYNKYKYNDSCVNLKKIRERDKKYYIFCILLVMVITIISCFYL